jgi:cell wall hydrolase
LRIRRLLFAFALVLSDGATPLYAALGDAPRCFPAPAPGTEDIVDANPLILEFRRTVPFYDAEERDYLIRTIVFEATGEPEEGKAAVAHVVLNRIRSGKWRDNIKEVVTQPWQFEPWMTRRKEMENLSPDDPRYQSAAQIADAVLSGTRPDPTAGATHFLNPVVVRERRGGSLPPWAQGEGQPIGRHTFYSPEEGNPAPRYDVLPVGVLATSASTEQLLGSGEAPLLQAKWNVPATGGMGDACQSDPLTAGSPDLPAVNLVHLDTG